MISASGLSACPGNDVINSAGDGEVSSDDSVKFWTRKSDKKFTQNDYEKLMKFLKYREAILSFSASLDIKISNVAVKN